MVGFLRCTCACVAVALLMGSATARTLQQDNTAQGTDDGTGNGMSEDDGSDVAVDDGSRKYTCPYPNGRVNPLVSGELPDTFVHPEGDPQYEPFKPNLAVDAATWDANEFCVDHETPTNEEFAQGRVLIKNDDGSCSTCGEAKCTVWIPSPDGDYTPDCTGGLKIREDGLFQMKFVTPGNEMSKGWGSDPFPHVHFECTGCGGTFWNKYYLEIPETYCSFSEKKTILISQPNESNLLMTPSAENSGMGTFYIIMQNDWEMKVDEKWAEERANPCDGGDNGGASTMATDDGSNDDGSYGPTDGGDEAPTDGGDGGEDDAANDGEEEQPMDDSDDAPTDDGDDASQSS